MQASFGAHATMSRHCCPEGQSASTSHSSRGHPFASKRQLSPHWTVSEHGNATSHVYQLLCGQAGSTNEVVELPVSPLVEELDVVDASGSVSPAELEVVGEMSVVLEALEELEELEELPSILGSATWGPHPRSIQTTDRSASETF